jgi:hypothetical protein
MVNATKSRVRTDRSWSARSDHAERVDPWRAGLAALRTGIFNRTLV